MNLQKINRKGIAIFMIVRNNFCKQEIIAPFFHAKLNLTKKDRLESVAAGRVGFLRFAKESARRLKRG